MLNQWVIDDFSFAIMRIYFQFILLIMPKKKGLKSKPFVFHILSISGQFHVANELFPSMDESLYSFFMIRWA